MQSRYRRDDGMAGHLHQTGQPVVVVSLLLDAGKISYKIHMNCNKDTVSLHFCAVILGCEENSLTYLV